MPNYPPAIAKSKSSKIGKEQSLRLAKLWNRVSEKSVIDFTRGLAVMMKASIPLVKALDTAIDQTENTRLEGVLKQVRKDVKGGNSLAKSLSKHEDIFDGLYIHLVKVGELAGILDEILFRLSSYMEKRYSLKQKIRMAMVYPSLVMMVAVCAVLFMLLFIVPTFAEMYHSFDAELPAPTRFILALSQGLTGYSIYIILGLTVSIVAFRSYLKTSRGRYQMDRLKLSVPFFGTLYQKMLMTRFCQTLGTLLKSGITLIDSLEIICKASGNVLVTGATKKMMRSVKKGGSLTKSLRRSRVFPGMVIQMVTVGEETAELDVMLLHIAELYDEEVDIAVEGLTSIIEPVLIVVLGILLGGIIIAMYLPIFELMNVIK